VGAGQRVRLPAAGRDRDIAAYQALIDAMLASRIGVIGTSPDRHQAGEGGRASAGTPGRCKGIFCGTALEQVVPVARRFLA
jgi:hypothetical protein